MTCSRPQVVSQWQNKIKSITVSCPRWGGRHLYSSQTSVQAFPASALELLQVALLQSNLPFLLSSNSPSFAHSSKTSSSHVFLPSLFQIHSAHHQTSIESISPAFNHIPALKTSPTEIWPLLSSGIRTPVARSLQWWTCPLLFSLYSCLVSHLHE
jgi:hypothetical protein